MASVCVRVRVYEGLTSFAGGEQLIKVLSTRAGKIERGVQHSTRKRVS